MCAQTTLELTYQQVVWFASVIKWSKNDCLFVLHENNLKIVLK